ncbi:hypothetical protein QUA58_31410 [Microcoleus sp. N9_A1]
MAKNYAKSGKEDDKRNSPPRRGGLGGIEEQSKSTGDEVSDGIPEGDSTWLHRGPEDSIDGGKANIGKILSQLRVLQQSHLAYVEAHEERLKNRLKAAEEHHNNITDQMNQLEQEILALLGETV